MNTLYRQLPVVLALAAASAAHANIDRQPAPDAVQRIELTASRQPVEAVLQALRETDTAYEMSNGRRMEVSAFGEYLHLRYGKRTVKAVRHDGRGNFVSADGQVSLQFELDRSGQARLVRLTAPADWL